MQTLLRALAAAAALVFVVQSAACTSVVGCDLRESEASQQDRCREAGGATANTLRGNCVDGLKGKIVEGGCSRDDAVGECLLATESDGTETRDVYYAPVTKADAQTACEGDDGEFTEQ